MAITFVKRPTTPLDFEPFETPPEDILYPGSDQEDEIDEERRAKKKLRIELLAKQYLEGRGLFIQSAALKGPFERGWVNPWCSRKRKHGRNRQRSSRDPITEDGRYTYTETGTGCSTVKRTSVRDVAFGQSNHDLEKRASMGRRSTEQEEHAAKRRRCEPLEEPTGQNDPQRLVNAGSPSYTTEQEPWLKTNQPYLQHDARNDRKSPTPTPFARNTAQTPITPPPRTYSQGRTRSVSIIPTAQDQCGGYAGFTSVNKPLVSQHKGNIPANISRTRNDLQHEKTATGEYDYIRVKERDLGTVDEATKRGYKEVKRPSQDTLRQIELKNGDYQSKSSQKGFQPANSGTSRKPGCLEPYVSIFAIADEERKVAGRRASSRPQQPSPHVVPPSTYVPEFQYRYTGSLRSHGSSEEKASFAELPEEVRSRLRATSSSSGSDSFAEALEAAQAKADSKSMASSHSSSPAAEGHETTSVRKNTSAMKRLTFSPMGSTKIAPCQTSSRPGSNSSTLGPGASALQTREEVGNASREYLLIRKGSTKSSDLPSSDGNRPRNSVIFPEAQVAAGALIQPSQRPSGSSTNLLETDRPLPKYPSLDEGDSYANLSTQAAFIKAQRSFKDDVLSSLKASPTEIKEERSAASRPAVPGPTPTANGGFPRDTSSQWEKANWQDNDNDEPMSTQAMIDGMSPFAITTVKKRPPVLNERTSFAPTPTRQKLPAPTTIRAPDPPLKAPESRQNHATRSIGEQSGRASATATKSPLRHVACTQCRKDKRRCTHDVFGNEISIRAMEQPLPLPNAPPSRNSPDENDLAQSSQPILEAHNPGDPNYPAPDGRDLESPTNTPFRFHSLSMSTSPSQNPPKRSPPIPLTHPNTTSKPASSLSSSSILPDGTYNDTSVFQDGQQQQQDWNISLPLDPFGLFPEEPARSGGPFNRDGGAASKSDSPATSTRLDRAKEPDSLDLSAAIDDASSFLGEWNVEAEARKLSGNGDAGFRSILSLHKRDV
ncbi:hypothetical protein N7G274_002958 [Stereocaulon virgatum]|uniref:Uncharacterized protein n=1 Tax=Stereocaulon virgatum TaxID=373712 RepID=A0ABR4AGP1_9LECA